MTYLKIINAVLTRLRESNVVSPGESAYSLLLGEFVKETKREMENAWNWNSLRSTKTVTTAQGTSEYTITGSGKKPVTLDVYNTTVLIHVQRTPSNVLKEQILTGSEGVPAKYYYEGVDSSGDTNVHFWAIPDGVYVINFELVIPQADPVDGGDEITMDEWPIILGSYAKAIAERGEDQGRTGGEAVANFRAALSDSIALDVNNTSGEDVWHV